MFSTTPVWQLRCLKSGMTEITSRCFFLLLVAASLHSQTLSSVRPDSGKVGAVLRVQGSELSKAKIDSVYLSDQTLDMMVKVLNQSDNFIEFRIPPSVKPGRFQLVIKTAGKQPQILEMPVYIKVEESPEPAEVASTR
jgi:hypothetical protein